MTAFHQYILAIGSFQGVLLFFLLVCNKRTTAATKVLGLCCSCMGLTFFLPFITYGIAADIFYPLAAWLFFLPMMYGALLHLYCSKVIFNHPFKTRDLAYLIPLFSCYALNFDVLLFQHELFRLWIVGASAPTQRLWISEYILFAVPIGYLVSTVFLIKRYHQQASNTLSNFNPSIFIWLGVLVISFIGIFLCKGVMAFTYFETRNMIILSDAVILLLILLITLTQWRNPQFFVVNNQGNEKTLTLNTRSAPNSTIGLLDSSTRAAVYNELTQYIEREHIYRDSELNLAKLATAIGVSVHHLSEVLNQHAGVNFNHFINAYRVEEVCKKLRSPDSLKVLDIAMQAGFSSKSTFNTLFKKFKGVTPTQYREKQRKPI